MYVYLFQYKQTSSIRAMSRLVEKKVQSKLFFGKTRYHAWLTLNYWLALLPPSILERQGNHGAKWWLTSSTPYLGLKFITVAKTVTVTFDFFFLFVDLLTFPL